MPKLIKAIARGIKAMAEGPDAPTGDTFTIAGKALRCPHCAHDRFEEARAQLDTPFATLVRPNWVSTLTCVRCGRIELFQNDGESLD